MTPHPLIWPLAFLLVALLVVRQIRDEMKPVARAVVDGLAKHGARHSLAYAMAILYATAASLQALADVARDMGWLYVEAFAKVVQPGAVAIIAFVRPSPAESGTRPPIP